MTQGRMSQRVRDAFSSLSAGGFMFFDEIDLEVCPVAAKG
jgi:hypothetical protein